MNFIRLSLQHTWATLKNNWLFFILLAAIHLATNAAFTGFASFAFNTLFFGSRIPAEIIGLIAGAPLTASLAVIITSVTFGTAHPANVLNRRFLGDWIPVTIIYAWFFFIAWYCRVHLPVRMTSLTTNQPWISEYLTPKHLIVDLPWLVTMFVASITMLAVPTFVARRQAFRKNYSVLAPSIALAISVVFMTSRAAYENLTGQLNPYLWLPFPGFHPEGIAYDQMIYGAMQLPFLIPASILISCLMASMAIAANQDSSIKRSPVNS